MTDESPRVRLSDARMQKVFRAVNEPIVLRRLEVLREESPGINIQCKAIDELLDSLVEEIFENVGRALREPLS